MKERLEHQIIIINGINNTSSYNLMQNIYLFVVISI